MAFSTGNGFSGGRRGRFSGSTSLAEINIVPLVDVVLVLLIIFMLTAHVMEFGLEVEVPKVKPVREDVQDLPVVNLDQGGTLYLNDRPVNVHELVDTIRRRYKKSQSVYLRADRRVSWEEVAGVIAMLGDAKLGVNVVTQPEDMTGKKRR